MAAGCDAIIYLAGHTRVLESIHDPESDFEINVHRTLNVVGDARLHTSFSLRLAARCSEPRRRLFAKGWFSSRNLPMAHPSLPWRDTPPHLQAPMDAERRRCAYQCLRTLIAA
jgi:hypothetical protein